MFSLLFGKIRYRLWIIGGKALIRKVSLTIALFFVFVTYSSAYIPNSPYNWGFNKSRNGVPADAGEKYEEMIAKYDAVYKDSPNKKTVYLTFDNGYENGYTDEILDVLKKHHVPAAFFVTGHYLLSAEDLVIRMSKEGHIIGNHSWHHPDMTQVTNERLFKELDKVKKKTEEITGKKGMQYLRPPRGIFSERTMAAAKEAGYVHVFWSLAFKDWNVDAQQGPDYAYQQVMAQIHPGAIILLHTISKDNAEALERIIVELKKQGYKFKSLDDLYMKKEMGEKILKR
jgi:peptidoglycan-N-acetylmuramic acid deacetylase